MENSQELSEKQVTNEWVKKDIIKNSETQRKLDIINNPELNKLSWFSNFIQYLSEEKNNEKLDTISKIIQAWLSEKLKQYIDLNSTDWKDVLNEDYLEIKERFEREIKIKIEEVKTQEASEAVKKEEVKTKEAVKTKEEKNIEIIENIQVIKNLESKYSELKWKLKEIKELNNIYVELNNKDSDFLNIDKLSENTSDVEKINLLNKATLSLDEVNKTLKNEKERILEALLEKYKKSWTEEDEQTVLKFADTFKALWVIDDTRHNQIIQEVFKIREESNKTKEFWWNKSLPLITDHEQKWDTLSRHADKVDFTIKDWVITCEWKSMKLVDYSSHDKETKAFMKKTWISGEINELNWELKQNEFILKWLNSKFRYLHQRPEIRSFFIHKIQFSWQNIIFQ